MLVDTHTHFYDPWLLPDAEAAIERALEAGVGKMIQADIDSHERPAMWAIGARHPGVIYQMLGLYPGSVTAENWQYELDQVHAIAQEGDFPAAKDQALCRAPAEGVSFAKRHTSPGAAGVYEGAEPPVLVAIGEIGLDYHEGKEFAQQQQEVLRIQLELAARLNLPVNIHLRDAWEDFLAILKDTRHLHLRGNLHCFSGSYELYEAANRYGQWSVGIGGVVTFKNSKLAQTVARIPLEDILLETDAPYLAPTPHRGERNESAFLPLIAAKVAEIKGLPVTDIETLTTRNAEKLFQI